MPGTRTRARTRCGWVNDDPLYVAYHDEEWGVPVRDDRRLFEMLVLDGAQAGLSWYTILKKREAYRRAFDGFDPECIARYGEKKIASLLEDTGIVRNRLKVQAAIGNARAWLDLRESGVGFSDFLWEFTGGVTIVNAWRRLEDVPATTPGLRGDEQGAEAPRVPLRRSDHLLRFHAGRGDGERPPHLVLPLEGVQEAVRMRARPGARDGGVLRPGRSAGRSGALRGDPAGMRRRGDGFPLRERRRSMSPYDRMPIRPPVFTPADRSGIRD